MAKHEASDHRMPGLKEDTRTEPSYGEPVEQPKMVKGRIDNFGILAGDCEVTPKRNITFDDSIDDNRKNQSKSH